ncbi:ATP-binding protein [Ensifer aridi]|uniref:ATP-binding protein n=1 Tax=Ensifer aridi TaxID=1708715 RepID=UPI003B8358D6
MAATALLDRLLHHAVVVQIDGSSYRLRQHAELTPEHVRSKAMITPPAFSPPPKPRRRPPKKGHFVHDDPVSVIGEFYFGTPMTITTDCAHSNSGTKIDAVTRSGTWQVCCAAVA